MRRTFAQSCFLGGMGENGSGERRRNTGECNTDRLFAFYAESDRETYTRLTRGQRLREKSMGVSGSWLFIETAG